METQGNTIIIEPAEPEVVYVPTYDPWIVYGTPVVPWPGWYWYPGLYVPGPGIGFGLGFGFGFLAGFAWGWHHWGCDWGHRTVIYNHTTYISHSTTIVNRDHFTRTTNNFNHTTNNINHGQAGAQHGPSVQSGVHSGAFGGFNHGAVSNGFSARGRSSFGGEFHGGGSMEAGAGNSYSK